MSSAANSRIKNDLNDHNLNDIDLSTVDWANLPDENGHFGDRFFARGVGRQILAGCDRLTIGPNFLEELSQDDGSLPRRLSSDDNSGYVDCDFVDESDFRLQLNANAMATEKLAEGIRGFVADQIKLEALLADRLASID